MDSKLLEMLVCPVTKGSLVYKRRVERQADGETESQIEELWCRASRLAYPVKDGVPVMLETQARPLTDEEYAELKK